MVFFFGFFFGFFSIKKRIKYYIFGTLIQIRFPTLNIFPQIGTKIKHECKLFNEGLHKSKLISESTQIDYKHDVPKARNI